MASGQGVVAPPLQRWLKIMNIAILMLSALSVCSVSCSPVYSVKRYGISATLTHANTAAPIIETPIVVTVDGNKFKRTTNRKGAVRLAPDLQTHMSWLGGPAIQSDPVALIELSCDGFDPVRVEWFRHFPDRNFGILEDRGVIDLGELSLTTSKSQQVAAPNP